SVVAGTGSWLRRGWNRVQSAPGMAPGACSISLNYFFELEPECGHLNWPRVVGGVSSPILAPPVVRIFALMLPARRFGSGAVASGDVRADQEGPPGRGHVDPGAGRVHVHGSGVWGNRY